MSATITGPITKLVVLSLLPIILICLEPLKVAAESFSEKLELIQQKDKTLLASFSFEIDIEQASLSLARGSIMQY